MYTYIHIYIYIYIYVYIYICTLHLPSVHAVPCGTWHAIHRVCGSVKAMVAGALQGRESTYYRRLAVSRTRCAVCMVLGVVNVARTLAP